MNRVLFHRAATWFALAVVAVSASGVFPPAIRWDWLNIIPAAAVTYLGWRVLGSSARVWLRTIAVFVLMLCLAEFSLRVVSYQRALLYARYGDLLFGPVPNQTYVEKISLSESRMDQFGLRAPSTLVAGRTTVLCLGDSVTYGYGMADGDTWPAQLEQAMMKQYPGRFNVLNGGINAYPMSFIHQKFLHHWNQGLRPDVVIIGYSMNEGWLGHLVDADEEIKRAFEKRVMLKNLLRSSALYNTIVENWARHAYEAMRYKLIPGTNSTTVSASDVNDSYALYLERFVADVRARNVTPVFVLFAALNGETMRYDTLGPFQQRFAAFAAARGIPLLRTDVAFREELGGNPDLSPFYFDPGHMTERGNRVLARKLASWLPEVTSTGFVD
jgi:lysophospholipase L1-like esterase